MELEFKPVYRDQQPSFEAVVRVQRVISAIRDELDKMKSDQEYEKIPDKISYIMGYCAALCKDLEGDAKINVEVMR